jgi:putative Mg2+ transporter-C (MgtC) family protein
MDATAPVNLVDLTLRLLIATVLGVAIGVNREWHHKPAGMRTHGMVALGAALITLAALGLAAGRGPAGLGDVSRVLQGIIAGVGFVGGGVIMRRDDPQGVHGMTTATSIWVVAATGVTAGLGMWRAAVIAVAIALLLLTLGALVDRTIHRLGPPDAHL